MRIVGVELTNFAGRHLVAGVIEKPDRRRTDTLAPDRTELGKLLLGAQHGNPTCLARAVNFIEAGVWKHLHDRALRFLARRGRGDHQLGDLASLRKSARGGRKAEHHDVMRWNQRGESGTALDKRTHTMLRVETAARVDRRFGAAIDESAKEIQRISV